MKPVYVDIHIHTSENPNSLNQNYDVDMLVKRVKELSGDYPILLSLTDHNIINKQAYINLLGKIDKLIIGVELHIKKYDDAPPYHCHALFSDEVSEENIDKINMILDKLYPEKIITNDTAHVPNIEDIANNFDSFDYILLPHGGQSHKTFDKATGRGHRFDTSLERSLYFNHFEGFTARSNTGLQETIEYFKRLGIDQFVNLLTCSDNYDVRVYPCAKDVGAEAFIPTWIFSSPSFDGLRLALSEKSRIFYGEKAPEEWNQAIYNVKLDEPNCDIDVSLLPGLNVVIGGSSSGKTLFVESLVKGICGDFSDNSYGSFGTEKITVDNPSGIIPHYINQNFIMSVLNDGSNDIGKIDLINEVFPEDQSVVELIRKNLEKLKRLVEQLVDATRKYQNSMERLRHLPDPSFMVITKEIPMRIASLMKPDVEAKNRFLLTNGDYEELCLELEHIRDIFVKSKLDIPYELEIQTLKKGLKYINDLSNLSEEISMNIDEFEQKEMERIADDDKENSRRIKDRKNMSKYISDAIGALFSFDEAKRQLGQFNISVETKRIKVDNYTLSIENTFQLTADVLKEAINRCIKNEYRINSFEELTPECIFDKCFSERPKVSSYDDFTEKVFQEICEKNVKRYKVITDDGRNFDDLSPGWKSAIILDLIIGFKNDSAPLIIDQPEDNLATDYINHGLVEGIKNNKNRKQIILVTHNATIPMLADAQNVIVCKNEGGRIIIRSAALEEKIDDRRILDFVAEITDGGKQSIRKRVKKYDLKAL